MRLETETRNHAPRLDPVDRSRGFSLRWRVGIIHTMKTRYPHVYALTVMSDDHPGIVAAVSNAVESLGGNIDSCSQTVLGGYFTLIMIVSLPEEIEAQRLAERVRGSESSGTPYQVLVRPARLEAGSAAKESVDRFVITAFGNDQPGIVRRFSQYLASKDVNIVDLYGDRSGDEFVLIGEVEVPMRWDVRMMQADLEQMGQELGFTVKLQHANIFVATNQLRLPRGRS
jgi:glycine cleavage system transcriptional repressor